MTQRDDTQGQGCSNRIWIASAPAANHVGTCMRPLYLEASMVNHHGGFFGATGTGKTQTLKVTAEGLSDLGVAVLVTDVKGDAVDLAVQGTRSAGLDEKLARLNIAAEDFLFRACPVRCWDPSAASGTAAHGTAASGTAAPGTAKPGADKPGTTATGTARPGADKPGTPTPLRVTAERIGPELLARLMSLTAVQGQVLCALFRLASDEGASLTDCEDLQAVVSFAAAHAERLVPRYGHMSPQTLAVIQRAVLHLETQGAGSLLGAPALDVGDFVTQDSKGHGIVNIIDCVELSQAPFAYAALMLCLMRELRERLPEVGDAPTPRLAFFVDEAHTLFKDAPAALLSDVERTVRLIRSKGVGIYFVTQSPSDIPGPILAQLGNRIYHGMRSFTVDDQKALRAAAAGLRQNPLLDATSTLGELRRGEALISLLDKDGAPSIVERAEVLPPRCRLEVAAYPAGPPVIHNKDIGMDKNTHDLDDITAAKHALAAAKPPVAKAGSQSVKGQGIKEKPRPSLFHDLQDIAQAVQRISAASPLEDLLLPAARNAADALLDGAFRRAEQLAHARKRSEKSRQARQHPAKNNKPKRKRRT